MAAESLYNFPARMAALPKVLQLLRAQAPELGSDALLRAETALEELLTNTVVHGQAGTDPQSEVWVGVQWQGESCVVRYQDARAPFDPQPRIDEAMGRTLNPMDQRPPGGLGLLLVFRMADAFRYAHREGRNCFEMEFRPRAPVPSQPDPA